MKAPFLCLACHFEDPTSYFLPPLQVKGQWLGLETCVMSLFLSDADLALKAMTLTPSLLFMVPSQLPCLSSYDSYCSNQVAAKALLDHKKQDHRVQDFLQRCLESPFSRKLDLWNFLDIPRSRLVKYPLLLREILRHTPNDNPDQQHLEEAVSLPVSFPLPVSISVTARV